MTETAGENKIHLKKMTEAYTKDLCKLLGLHRMRTYLNSFRRNEDPLHISQHKQIYKSSLS